MQRFRDALRNDDFVVTADLPLSPGSTAADIGAAVHALRPFVTALQVIDNRTAQPHMSPLAAAALVLQSGMDAVIRMNCRDRNRIALQADLMGAAALGVTTFVASRGEKLPASLKQRVKGVFDIGTQRLLATARAISANERLVAPPGFLLGANATIIDPPADWAADGVDAKADAGSRFLQTQPCLDIEILQRYMQALVARKALERLSVVVQVPLADSMEMLQELRAARQPLLVPDHVVARLQEAADFAGESAAACAGMLAGVAKIPGVAGANIVHRGDPATVARMLAASTHATC